MAPKFNHTDIQIVGDFLFHPSGGFVKQGLIVNAPADASVTAGEEVIVVIYQQTRQRENVDTLCREAVAALSNHQNESMMHVIGYSVDEVNKSEFYLLMKYVTSINLTYESISAAKQELFSPAEWVTQVVNWFLQIVTAVSHLHEQHCRAVDLCLRNLLLCSHNKKITVVCRRVCREGDVVSPLRLDDRSWRYAAPEILVEDGQCTEYSDLFSIGCIFLEIMTLRIPYHTHDAEPVGRQESEVETPCFDDFTWPVTFPGEIESLIESLLDVYDGNRGTFDVVLDNLREYAVQFCYSIKWTATFFHSIDIRPELQDALKMLANCDEPPITRSDVSTAYTLLKSPGYLDWVYDDRRSLAIARGMPDTEFIAILLYTHEGPVYKVLNAAMTSASENVVNIATPALPLFKRICVAVKRHGVPFGPQRASRFLFADGSLSEQLHNYEAHFQPGTAMKSFQLMSFTKQEKLASFSAQSRPQIVFRCNNLEGYDIFHLSSIQDEDEVLVLPPSVLTVERIISVRRDASGRPYRVEVQVSYSRWA